MGKSSKEDNGLPIIDLREMEMEVLAEGREWMRRRMEEKLRAKAAAFSPGGGKDAQARRKPGAEIPDHERACFRKDGLRPGSENR